jgi:ketosteroid isomerase-like protein
MSATESAPSGSKKVVIAWMETFGTGDLDAVLDSMTDDATYWIGGTIPGLSGTHDKTALRKVLDGITESCTGPIRLTPQAFTVDGDRVAVETESYVELKNGRVYNNHYHFVFVVRDGKVAQIKEYLDTMHTYDTFVA